MRQADESEIDKRAFRVRTRARLCPPLLFSARTGRLDAKPDARAGCDIERETRAAPEKSIAYQRSHTVRRNCNRLARENGRDRAAVGQESAESSYRMARQCCVFSPRESRTAKASS